MVDQIERPGAPRESEYKGHKITRENGEIVIEGMNAKPRIPKTGDHDENLADLMDESELTALAQRLIEYHDADKASREDWERTEKRAMEMMGIVKIPSGDEDEFPGIHKVVHPLLAEAVEQFASRAIVEVFPDAGPVKTKIIGKQTKERVAQSHRIETFGNYYFTEVDDGYFNDTDQMLKYLPLFGSAFRKVGLDWTTGIPELRYVKASNFIAPYSGSTLKKLSRYCHVYTMMAQDIDQAVDLGLWRETDLGEPSIYDTENPKTEDKSDGRTVSKHEDDWIHTIYEYHVNLRVKYSHQPKAEARVAPYIICVERDSQKVTMVRRNWKKSDKKFRKRIWFAHHKFLQGLGFYGWGYLHVIGSLLRAVSGSVNALLDASYAATFQGGFRTKEGRDAGIAGECSISHGVWKDVNATYEEISKAFYTPQFKEPSAALFNLMGGLIESGQRFMSTTQAAVGDADNRGPVGTTIALIEESQRIPNAIHKRLHISLGQELKAWAEMVYDVMPNRYDYETDDEERFLLKEDFDGRVDIIPVTNPNISSSTQRLATGQLVLEVQAANPDLFPPAKRAAGCRRIFEAARVPDIDEIGPEVEAPKYIDPVAENGLMLVGKGVRAYETQDHTAHLAVHQNGLAWAQSSMDPKSFEQYAMVSLAHQREHQALAYRQMVAQAAGIEMPPLGPDGLPPELDAETEAMITAAVVLALPPPPPPPEAEAGPDEAAAEIERKDAAAGADIERKTAAFEADEARKAETHARQLQRDDELHDRAMMTEDQRAAADIIRQGAKDKAQDEITRAQADTKDRIAVSQGELKNKLTADGAKQKAEAAKAAAKKKGNGKDK
jgi:hypothetical protein